MICIDRNFAKKLPLNQEGMKQSYFLLNFMHFFPFFIFILFLVVPFPALVYNRFKKFEQ